LLIGYITGKLTYIKVSSIRSFITKLYDPITVRLKKRLHVDFQKDIKEQRRIRLFTTIFLNNLIFSALISRTFYGLLFFYPYVLTIIGSFNQGIVYSRITIINPILLMEFIAYLIAGTAGSYLGIRLLTSLFTGSDFITAIIIASKLYLFIIPILMLHATIEVHFMTKFKVPDDFKIDMDKARNEMLKRLDS
jgi:hypothetical protein